MHGTIRVKEGLQADSHIQYIPLLDKTIQDKAELSDYLWFQLFEWKTINNPTKFGYTYSIWVNFAKSTILYQGL